MRCSLIKLLVVVCQVILALGTTCAAATFSRQPADPAQAHCHVYRTNGRAFAAAAEALRPFFGASCDDNTAGNGKCDSYNNYDSCAKQYDGGDCCASTCIAGSAGACKGVNATSCNVPGANVCRSIGCSGDLGVLQQAPEFVRHLPCCLGSNNATTVISIIIPPFPFTSLRVGDEVQLNWTCHGCAQTDKVNIDLMRSVKSSGEEFLRTIRTDLFALAGAAVIQVQDVKSNTVIDFGQGDMFFYRIGLARNASIFNDTSQFSIEGGENRVTTEGLTAFAIIAIIVGAIVVFCSVNVILKSFSYKQ